MPHTDKVAKGIVVTLRSVQRLKRLVLPSYPLILAYSETRAQCVLISLPAA